MLLLKITTYFINQAPGEGADAVLKTVNRSHGINDLRQYYDPLLSSCNGPNYAHCALGFGSERDCEADIYAFSMYDDTILKVVDLKNAFNLENSDTLLTQTELETFKIYKFLWKFCRHSAN